MIGERLRKFLQAPEPQAATPFTEEQKQRVLAPYLPVRRQSSGEQDSVLAAREFELAAFVKKHKRQPQNGEEADISLRAFKKIFPA